VLPLIDVLDAKRKCGVGTLTVERAAKRIFLPLKGIDIRARVVDRIAQVTVKEVFQNPYTDHLEAVYIFPLAGASAVSDFEMRVADRVIKGQVKERAEARREYARAIEEGKRAALLEQERDDVFTVQVGNLPPGEEITVVLTYSERLPYFEDGTTELRLPLVVAPRYIAGKALDRDQVGLGVELDTDAVPDASRITPPRLAEGFDPKVALSIAVELSLAGPSTTQGASDGSAGGLEDLSCSQHAVRTGIGHGAITVSLSRENEPINRDFVLRWRLSRDKVRPRVLFCRDLGAQPPRPAVEHARPASVTRRLKGGPTSGKEAPAGQPDTAASYCYAMLSMVPPTREGFLGLPRDVVFVIDRSGSMSGLKMTSAARACSILLSTLGPQDRFAIVAFDNTCEWMPTDKPENEPRFVEADEAGVERGNKFLRRIDARGGTELNLAVQEAISAISSRGAREGRVSIVVILTDGQVGDESNVLKQIQTRLGEARVFTVGIDTAVNDGFLKRLAALGGGTCTFVQPGEQLELALNNVGREIGNPLVTELELEDIGCGIERDTIAPGRIPDLFEGRAATCFFRFKPDGNQPLKLLVKGKYADGSPYLEEVEPVEVQLSALAQLWAKAHIADLEDCFRVEPGAQADIRKRIVDLSVRHSILTRFTAFVVVDESEVVNAEGSHRTVVQPVEMPAAWEMSLDGLGAGASGMWGAALQVAGGFSQSIAQAFFGAPCGGAAAEPRSVAEQASPCDQAPAAAPQGAKTGGYGFASGSGSYGSGVRAQVFEVICQQAMAGSRWRQVCAGPMQANNITPEEVEAEVARRRAALGKTPPAPGQCDEAQDLEKLRTTLDALAGALSAALAELKAGCLPSGEPIEKARAELLAVLVASAIGTAVPLLQRFLRVKAPELVAALRSAKSTVRSCLKLFERHQKAFEQARLELQAAIKGLDSAGGSFWEASI
jgi:Ca-activated chloride channel family protein